MINTKVVKRGTWILGIVLIELAVLSILGLIMSAWTTDYLEVQFPIIVILPVLIFTSAICIYTYKLLKRKWIIWAFNVSNDINELVTISKTHKLIGINDDINSLQIKYNFKIQKSEKIKLDEKALPQEVIVFHSKAFNSFFFILFLITFLGVVFWIIEEINIFPLIASVISLWGCIYFGIRLFSKKPVLILNKRKVVIKGNSILWMDVSSWGIRNYNYTRNNKYLFIKHRNRIIKQEITYMSITTYEIEYYIKNYIEKNK